VKLVAEPFLNTSRGVQDLVDNTSECVQRISTSRLSCTDLLVHATSQTSTTQVKEDAKDVYDEESQLEHDESKDESKKRRKHWTSRLLPCLPTLFSSSSSATRTTVPVASVLTRSMYYFALLISVVIVLLFIYAVFTVR